MANTFSNFQSIIPGWHEDGRSDLPILVELTAKRWKGLTLLSIIFSWIGLALIGWQIWIGIYTPLLETGFTLKTQPINMLQETFSGFGTILGVAIFTLAIAVGLYARFMAWWRHG